MKKTLMLAALLLLAAPAAAAPTQFEFGPGWTLVSFPVLSARGHAISSAIGDADVAIAFNNDGYDEVSLGRSLQPAKGYWIFSEKRRRISLEENEWLSTDSAASYSFGLNKGWNLIGAPFLYSDDLSRQKLFLDYTPLGESPLVKNGKIYRYDPDSVQYVALDAKNAALEPWRGYWIELTQSATLIVKREALPGKPQGPNLPPVSNAGRDITLLPGESAMLDGGESYDPDGETLSYLWEPVSGPPISIANSSQPSVYIQPPEAGEYIFMLTVTDAEGASHRDLVKATVCSPGCNGDAECDDGSALTMDSCAAAGMCGAVCTHAVCQSRCSGDYDCNDGDPNTSDACLSPGQCGASCQSLQTWCTAELGAGVFEAGAQMSVRLLGVNESDEDLKCGLKIREAGADGMTWLSFREGIFETIPAGGELDATVAVTVRGEWAGLAEAAYEIVAVSEAGEEWLGAASFAVLAGCAAPACSTDGDCDDGDPATAEACLNPGSCAAACSSCLPACSAHSDCDDGIAETTDVCFQPGTCDALCLNAAEPACGSDADCDDGDPFTVNTCQNPGQTYARCISVSCAAACDSDAACNDGNSQTADSCANPGTCAAACLHAPLACASNQQCYDGDPATRDICVNPGQADSSCAYEACQLACSADADCDDGSDFTRDQCQSPGSCSAACSNDCAQQCQTDADCDDGDPETAGSCTYSASCGPVCVIERRLVCLNDSDCDDGDPETIEECVNIFSYDPDTACRTVNRGCQSDWDCDDSVRETYDTCENPGEPDSHCMHEAVRCLTNSDCDDCDSGTIDRCLGGGRPGAVCYNPACSFDSNCDDGDPTTTDRCVNPWMSSEPWNEDSQCLHFHPECSKQSDCVDDNPDTSDICMNPSQPEAECRNFIPACRTNADCDDGDEKTLDVCRAPGAEASYCDNLALACWTNEDCADGDDETADHCRNGGLESASCSNYKGVVDAAAGQGHSCVLTTDGKVYCLGTNEYGQINPEESEPDFIKPAVEVDGIEQPAAIEAGDFHTCALLKDGRVQCWGRNDKGQLGNGQASLRSAPVFAEGITDAVQVVAGDQHSCARLSSGKIMCWGWNRTGQLGNGSLNNSLSPVLVSGIDNALAVAAGDDFTCAALANGQAKCWGWNDYGQLGNGSNGNPSKYIYIGSYVYHYEEYPVYVVGLNDAVDITAGAEHACATLEDATLKCWGWNESGQLGREDRVDRYSAVPAANISSVAALAAGAWNTCALIQDGTVQCWGDNLYYQLGGAVSENTHETGNAADVPGIENAIGIAGRDFHTCAVTAEGRALCWGWYHAGELKSLLILDEPTDFFAIKKFGGLKSSEKAGAMMNRGASEDRPL